MQTCVDDYRDAFNEEVSRILLGERVPHAKTAPATQVGRKELLEQTRALVEELGRLTWNPGLEEALTQAAEMPAAAHRIREIAVALTDLFEPDRAPGAAC